MGIDPSWKASIPCELLSIEGSYNVRDLGGYPTRDGRIVRHRRFIRAGSLSDLTPQGIQSLREEGVRGILDLRSWQEVRKKPDAIDTDDTITRYHIPMLDYIQSSAAEEDFSLFPASMEEMYVGLLDESGDSFARVFEIFADARYPCCLFHCTAGKDRTGVTAMLLLGLAGVEDAGIIEDYHWSQQLLPPIQPGLKIPPYCLESRPETMEYLLSYLRNRYGSVEEYLSGIGVTKGQQEAVRKKLLCD